MMTNRQKIIAALLFLIVLFFSTYKLTESPPTWTDEGIIVNSARVLAETGHIALQAAPGQYESAGIVTTSYTVTLPIAVVFKLFGVGLLQARSVMVLYLLIFFVLVYCILRKYILADSSSLALLAFAVLATFPPIYGDGKNVLGEIPGLVYLLGFLILLYSTKSLTWWRALGLGLTLGLVVITKPVFLTLLPALVAAYVIYSIQKRSVSFLEWKASEWKKAAVAFVAFLVPVVAWLKVQFMHDTVSHIYNVYANPGKIDLIYTVINNFKISLTHGQPLYFLALMFVWLVAIVLRLKRKEPVMLPELFVFIFSCLVYMSFLRLPPYYRYFFLAQVFALLYLMPNVRTICKKQTIAWVIGVILFITHLYGMLFSSWVATSYAGTKTRDLENYFANQASSTTYFLYAASEVSLFIPQDRYYQYFEVAPDLPVGSSTLSLVNRGAFDVVIKHDENTAFQPVGYGSKYGVTEDHVAGYTFLHRASKTSISIANAQSANK